MEEITVKPARSIRTGDYLLVGSRRRLVIQARVTEHAVTLSHPGGAVSTMEPSTRLKVARQSRIEDHDQAAEVRDLVHRSESPEPREVPHPRFSQPERSRPVYRCESQGGRQNPAVRFHSPGA